MRTRWIVVALPAVLSGCASMMSTYSEVSGDRYNLAIMDRRSVEIVRVGNTTGWANNQPVQVSPGTYPVVVASRPHGGFAGGLQQTLDLKVDPCKRYYINAQYANPITPDYRVVVDHVETIAGCRAPA
jgi:hypothetical protein